MFNWLYKLKASVAPNSEDKIIEDFFKGNPGPFINYFWHNQVKFSEPKGRFRYSPGGRISVENDIYIYLRIDGKWVENYDCLKYVMLYPEYRKAFDAMEEAVLSNIPGYISFENRYFRRPEIDTTPTFETNIID